MTEEEKPDGSGEAPEQPEDLSPDEPESLADSEPEMKEIFGSDNAPGWSFPPPDPGSESE